MDKDKLVEFAYTPVDCCACGAWGAVAGHFGPWWLVPVTVGCYVVALPIVSALLDAALRSHAQPK